MLYTFAARGLVCGPRSLLLLAGSLEVLVSQAGLANLREFPAVLSFIFHGRVVLIPFRAVTFILDQNRRLVRINFV